MEIRGFKAFNSDMTNKYGKKFEEGKGYIIGGKPRFGLQGNGYHFCERLEDTLRYFNGMEDPIQIASVISYGEVVEYYDEYYGYYDMYATTNLFIEHIYTREEIINYILNIENSYSKEKRIDRFLGGYKLTEDEINKLKIKFFNNQAVINSILYHQEHKLDVYEQEYTKPFSKVKSIKYVK